MKKQNLVGCTAAVSFASVVSFLVAAQGQSTDPVPSAKEAKPQPTVELQFRVGRYILTAESRKDGELRNVIAYARSGNPKHFIPRDIIFSESAHMTSKARNEWVLKNAIMHSYNVTKGVTVHEVRTAQLILKPD